MKASAAKRGESFVLGVNAGRFPAVHGEIA
jgi:hypothetical protein